MEQDAEQQIIISQPKSRQSGGDVIVEQTNSPMNNMMEGTYTKIPGTPPPPYPGNIINSEVPLQFPGTTSQEIAQQQQQSTHYYDKRQNNWFSGVWCCWQPTPSCGCGNCCEGCCNCGEDGCCSCEGCTDCCACGDCDCCCDCGDCGNCDCGDCCVALLEVSCIGGCNC